MRIKDLQTKTHFVMNNNGERVAIILPIRKYKRIIKELEELQDIRDYDLGKKNDNGMRVDFANYIKNRRSN